MHQAVVARKAMDRVCPGVSWPQAEGNDAKPLHRTLLPRRSNRSGSRGHRPCAECRRERFKSFCCAWQRAHPQKAGSQPSASDIDNGLNAERVAPKNLSVANLTDLPNGVFVTFAEEPYLVYNDW